MRPSELAAELSEGRIRPAYLLAGEEALLRDDALQAIQRAVLADGPLDFNFDRLTGDTATASALRDAVLALPVMASRRLVVLREPEGRRGSARAGLTDALAELVPELSEQDQSVLVVAAVKADKRSRWVKAFVDPAAIVDCAPPRGARALAVFVSAEAKKQNLVIERGAADLLAERVGPQLLLLRQELAKVALLAGAGEKILSTHVDVSTGQVAEEPIWDLTDAIGEGRAADAVGMLSRMISTGAPPPLILGALASHFRKLVRLAVGGRVAGAPFVVKKLERQARRYPSARLVACLHAIHSADTALKGAGALRPEMTLERLVLGLAS